MLQFLSFASFLIAGVTHIPRRRDPPGFWDSYRGSISEPEGFEVVQNSGFEWWIVVIGAVGVVYFAFHARGFARFLRGKRERRRHRTIRPIPGPEDRMRQFKDYRKR
jgi:hypothetical protein